MYFWSFKHNLCKKTNQQSKPLAVSLFWMKSDIWMQCTSCWRFLAVELKTRDIKLGRESISRAVGLRLHLIKLLCWVNKISESWYRILCTKINQTQISSFPQELLFSVMRFPEVWAFFTFSNVPLSFTFFVLLFWFIYLFFSWKRRLPNSVLLAVAKSHEVLIKSK